MNHTLRAILIRDCVITTEADIHGKDELCPCEDTGPENLNELYSTLALIKHSLNANHWTCFSLRAQGYTTREVASLAGVSHITALLGIKRGNALLEAMT